MFIENFEEKERIIKEVPKFEDALAREIEEMLMDFTGEVASGESDGEWDFVYNRFAGLALQIIGKKIR